MMRLTIPAIATVVLVAVVVIVIRWPSASVELASGTAAMPSLQELHATTEIHKLPIQEIEDQALIYTSQGKN